MMAKDGTYEVCIKAGRVYVIDQQQSVIGTAGTFDEAFENLRERQEETKGLMEEAGVSPRFAGRADDPRGPWLSYVGKWAIAFVFIALMSIPLSYSISIGIKNGVKGIGLPRGGEIWESIGDAILGAAKSDSLNDQPRQEEITDAMRHILVQLRPYLDVFSETEAPGGK